MTVLYVVGACLTKNTSANMSHNAYVQGLLENGCEVDILMAENSWGHTDNRLPIWEQADYYCYPSTALQDHVRIWMRKIFSVSGKENPSAASEPLTAQDKKRNHVGMKVRMRSKLKKAFYRCFPDDPLYPLNRVWLKKASRFRSSKEYDLVISNSSPAASHKLVMQLLEDHRIICKRWVQIWEDPWYADLYGTNDKLIFNEEYALLRSATEVYYVSPLTLEYQKKLFCDCANKMKHIPLPYLDFSQDKYEKSFMNESFGYFGDYYSHTRNLIPFYQTLKTSNFSGYIYGDSDLSLKSTDKIDVSGRVTLDKLAEIQEKTQVLVHLCNLRGGQIPGKIYHYSATTKPILFILDGTDLEKKALKQYFEPFERYYFCENTADDIAKAFDIIKKECFENKRSFASITSFSPKNVVDQLLTT